MKVKIVVVFPICTVFITALGTVAGFAARADDLGTAVYSGVNRLRQTCGVIGDDPDLTVAAQRHANDMLDERYGRPHRFGRLFTAGAYRGCGLHQDRLYG